ncbi:17446_t:CDS:2, partial [Cetraspora pellucida]
VAKDNDFIVWFLFDLCSLTPLCYDIDWDGEMHHVRVFSAKRLHDSEDEAPPMGILSLIVTWVT